MSRGLSYLVEGLSYEFCPGCSHGQIVDAMGKALSDLSPEIADVVLVSDIGCVGLVDKYFDINTFHGLHGRAITYATGLALARENLRVFVVVGDGGCGIGGHHLIQAARRGLGMTVLVFNNFNFGMTGGEQSTTTPLGAITSSTPGGNLEKPLDLCALAMAAGAPFVARMSAFDKELPNVVKQASEHGGFALVDVWEICTAYYMPFNSFKKPQLQQLSEQSGMPFGVLRNEECRKVPATPAAKRAAPRRVEITARHGAVLDAPRGILVAGSAGQKVKSAATTLARAAILSGLFATQKDDYPITVKTGHSVSELILSPRAIRFTGVDAPDVAIVLTNDGLSRTRSALAAMTERATIFAAEGLELPSTRAQVVRLDYASAIKRFGNENSSLWAVGEMLRHVGLVSRAAFEDAIRSFTPSAYREKALRAAGVDIVQA